MAITSKALRSACIGVALLVSAMQPAHAVDGLALDFGRDSHTQMWRAGAQWQWPQRWLQGEHWHVGGFWDLGAARWERDQMPGERRQLHEAGFTPVFRLQSNDLRGFYLEGGIGIHLLSATDLGSKRLGTSFQFGDQIGFGYRFGARDAFDISYRYQHLSNAGIRLPNNGLDTQQVRLQYWFR